MEERFRQDTYLTAALELLPQCQAVSFDVFDTLLFRTAAEPNEVLLELGRRLQACRPGWELIPPEVFLNLRLNAEREMRTKANAQGREDFTLPEMYRMLEAVDQGAEELAALELATEKDYVWLNPNVWSFLRHCHAKGKKIILLSDIYYSVADMRELLSHAGVELELVDLLLVSGQEGLLKHSGSLYARLLEQLPDVPPGCILHIGDNRLADVGKAQAAGLRPVWYGVVPQTHGGLFWLEKHGLASDFGLIASLRSLAMHTLPRQARTGEARNWYQAGAATVGPLYTFFAEWVLDEAKRLGVKHILPFMREGELLGRVLRQAAQNRGMAMEVQPLYISRRTAMLAGQESVDKKTVKARLAYPRLKLGELFAQLYLDVADTPFSALAGITLEECERRGEHYAIESFLCSKPTLARINAAVAEQRSLLADYVFMLTGGAPAITVDIGHLGTIQGGLSRALVLSGAGDNLHHRIMEGESPNARLVSEGIDIRGWLGWGGENEEQIKTIHTRVAVLEAAVNADVGSTLAYSKAGETVEPVLAPYIASEAQRAGKALFWKGVEDFQKVWFLLKQAKPGILKKILQQKSAFLAILARLLKMPLYGEAVCLGSLPDEEHTEASIAAHLCRPEDHAWLKAAETPEAYLANSQTPAGPCRWPEGVVAAGVPGYFHKQIEMEKPRTMEGKSKYLKISEIGKPVYLMPFTAKAALVYHVLKANGIESVGFCDNKAELHGQSYNDCPILSPGQAYQDHPDALVILCAIPHYDAMKAQLQVQGFEKDNIFKTEQLASRAHVQDAIKYLDRTQFAALAPKQVELLAKYTNTLHTVILPEGLTDPDALVIGEMEIPVTQKCTLKCRHCANMMQYYEKPKHYDFEQVCQDIDQLFTKIDYCQQFRIMGGEPLMYPQLFDLMRYITQYKGQYGTLTITTNATIVPPKKLLDRMKETNMQVTISDYGVDSVNLQELVKRLKECDISYAINTSDTWYGWQQLEDGRTHGAKEMFEHCHATCRTLIGGQLYYCEFLANARQLDAIPDNAEDSVPISGSKALIRQYLRKEIIPPGCRYCSGYDKDALPKLPKAQQVKMPLMYQRHK